VEECEVVVGFAVAAGGDAALGFEPGVRSFDRPAVARFSVVCFERAFLAAPDLAAGLAGRDGFVGSSSFADPRLDLAFAQGLLELRRVVAAVGPDLAWTDLACDQRVDQGQQVLSLVFVPGGESHLKRRPVCVYGQVIAASWFAQERARDLRAPFFASTNDASTITRDQSSLLPPASRPCNTRIASAKSPRRDHSSSRRRHVSPLGNPSSRYGTSNQGVSVNNTYSTPSRHARAE
jgi:hypothetical protein